MKKFIITLCVLTAAAILLTGCDLGLSVSVNYSYDEAGFAAASEGEKQTFDGTVQKVDVDWISGQIRFVKGDEFSVCENSINGAYFPMYCKLEGGTVYIKWAANGTDYNSFKDKEKKLTVTVTENVSAAIIKNVSSDYSVELYGADLIDIKNVSGFGSVAADSVKNFKYDGVSGDLKFESSISGKVDINNVSGNIKVTQNEAAASNAFSINTISGDIELTFPADLAGYTVNSNTVTGKFNSEFGDKEYGDGSVKIDFNSVSQSLIIKRKS